MSGCGGRSSSAMRGVGRKRSMPPSGSAQLLRRARSAATTPQREAVHRERVGQHADPPPAAHAGQRKLLRQRARPFLLPGDARAAARSGRCRRRGPPPLRRARHRRHPSAAPHRRYGSRAACGPCRRTSGAWADRPAAPRPPGWCGPAAATPRRCRCGSPRSRTPATAREDARARAGVALRRRAGTRRSRTAAASADR